MRLATITNWAYGATVALTLISGTTMLLASGAQEREREAVAQRYKLDQATARVEDDLLLLTEHARQLVITGDANYAILYRREAADLSSVENRIRHIRDAGASEQELHLLKDALGWADTLHEEQRTALAAAERGDHAGAQQLLFSAEYERELDRAVATIERFQQQIDLRTDREVEAATNVAKLWRTASEAMLLITGLLFLCVLYFVFKRRVLHPVVKLSDVVNRLAAQDFAVEPPDYGEVDEIGDMTQAIRVFRENGLERQRLENERNADRAVRDLLSRMTQRMQGCDTLLDVEEVVRRFVPEIAPELAGKLYLVDPSRNAVVEACSWQDPTHSRADFSTLSCWALRRGLPHRPAGEAIDVPCDHLCVEGTERLDTLCLPLTAHRQTLGLLYFEPRPGSRSGTPVIYLQMLAENVSLALANLRLRDALREMALADPLTGLANRRQLDAVIEFELAETERLSQPISALMIDVDHFKRFNDTFGHDAGDSVLREVGAALQAAIRQDGQAFRYGGEEFLLLMPGLRSDQALDRAEEIRRQVAALELVHEGRPLGKVSVSIGIASAPHPVRREQLVQAADSALYRAKAAGRDRAAVANLREDSNAA